MGITKVHVAQNRADLAIEMLEQAVAKQPDHAEAHNLLGAVYGLQNRIKEARAAFRCATELRDDCPEPYLNQARLLLPDGDPAAATKVLQESLSRLPGNEELSAAVTLAYEAAGRPLAAINIYENLLYRNPRHKVAANNLGALIADHQHKDRERPGRAPEFAARFQTSDISQFLDTLGWVHHRRGELTQAVMYLKRAVELAPEQSEHRYHLGAAYHALNQPELVREYLQRVLEGEPGDPGAAKARALPASLPPTAELDTVKQ